jgi:DNA-binding response OmpR family regulator
MAEAEDFDLVLMDVRMPGVDGLDATQRIRALPGPRGQVPILAFTAHAFPDQVRQCRQAGMSDVLTKPFTPKALLAAVTRCATTGRGRLGGMDVVDAALNSLDTDQSAASVNKLGPRPPTKQGELVGPVIEAKLPVVDLQQFQCMTADLTAEQVASYLLTITDRAERLLQGLRAPHQEHANAILASEAHTLAGSAGMFGFERLSVIARQFEDAVENDAADITTFSKALQAAIEITLLETNWLPIGNAGKVGLAA